METLASIDWKWGIWRVAVPLAAPTVISFIVAYAWASGNPGFRPSLSIAADVSPWALTFYSLTLIGSTLNDFWPKLTTKPVLGSALILVAVAVLLYTSFIVIWRHNPTFVPGKPVYGVTLVLLCSSVALCHVGYKAGLAQ